MKFRTDFVTNSSDSSFVAEFRADHPVLERKLGKLGGSRSCGSPMEPGSSCRRARASP